MKGLKREVTMAKKTTTKPVEEPTPKPTKERNMASENINIIELDQNLEDFEDFEPLPARDYVAELRKAETRISEKGNEYFYVTFNIHPEDFPADYDVANAPEGLNLIYSRLMAVNPQDRRSVTAMKKFYKALGMSLKTPTIDCSTWEGKKAKLIVGREEYNGELRNAIKSIEAID